MTHNFCFMYDTCVYIQCRGAIKRNINSLFYSKEKTILLLNVKVKQSDHIEIVITVRNVIIDHLSNIYAA